MPSHRVLGASRTIYNGIRGLAGSHLWFPLAERLEGRDLSPKQINLAADMGVPFAERRIRSWDRLKQTVSLAAARVPYYRDLFASIGFDPEALSRDPRYLADIPILTKDIIREQGDRLLREDHADFRKHVSKTGGSTGPSACVTYDQEAADWSSSATRFARAQIGATSSRLQMHLATRFRDKFPVRDRLREQIKCLANNRVNVEFASFADDELDAIWSRVKATRPFLIYGHPSTLYQLATHVMAKDDVCRAFDVFESSGETLDQKQLETIERVFGCKVINRYGLAEAGVVAYQVDPQRQGMLVFDTFTWPEIIEFPFADELADVPGSQTGELVITALRNHMMPLIRYRTGDIATLRDDPDGFFVQQIIGRVHDVVEIAGKKIATHNIQDMLDRIEGIREFQIENKSDALVFRIVAESGSSTEAIRQKIVELWSNSIEVEFVEFTALKLQGWRSKFRHLVASPAG